MLKNKLTKALLLMLCAAMLIPSFGAFTVFADDDISWEDMWKDTLLPAYMSTEFKTIKDRLTGNTVVSPMTLFTVVNGYAFYLDSITGEMVALTLADPTLTKEQIDESGDIPEYTAYYSTNPFGAGSSVSAQGDKSSDSVKEKIYSQLIIQFSMNNQDSEMNSFSDGAANNQITVSNIRGGVRVEYSIGREQVTYLAPRLIRADKFEALVAQVEKNSDVSRDAMTLKAFYIYYDINDDTKAEKTKQQYLEEYPVLEKFPIYACEKRIATKELLRIENIIKLYTDYTLEQMEIDHAETEYESTEENPPLFKLALEYTADEEGGISIRLNAGNVRFASDIYSLSNIVLLPYGGAGNINNEGYILTPDGSGSLIAFEDVAKAGNFTTTNPLYGIDYVYHTITGANKEVFRLPVYGVVEWASNGTREEDVIVTDPEGNIVYKTDPETGEYLLDENGNQIPETEKQTVEDFLKIGYLAVIEEGDSLAKIAVANGGSQHSFVSVYTTFNPRPNDTYSLQGGITNDANATWTVSSKRKYTGDYKIRLFMLNEEVNYSEMARTYREYLVNKGVLTALEDEKEDIPLYIETLGAMETYDTVLGIPINKMIALSSFEDDINILKELASEENGITNVNLKINGWINGGMFSTATNKIDIEKALGGEEGFKTLVEYVNSTDATLFPDLEMTLVHAIDTFDGFSTDKDNAKTIDDRLAGMKMYDASWQSFINTGSGILSTAKMEIFYDKAYEDYKQYNVGAVSVCSMGDLLCSDFNEDQPLTREDSKVLVKRLLAKIKEQNSKVLISGGNAYALEYATDIIDIPLDSSGYRHAQASVPFMGMVLHGYKEYAGPALNLAGDYQYTLLKSIENGASPYFVVASNNTAVLKDYSFSILAQYYSVRYVIWKESIIEAYNMLNDALSSVKYQTIQSHELLDNENKVVKVTYSNGEVFYVNYLIKDYTVQDGNKTYDVPAYGFVKVCADGSVVTFDCDQLS